MAHLTQNSQIVPISVPMDVGGAAMTGDWVSMVHFNHCTIVYVADIGTAGEDVEIVVLQATDNAASGSKALAPAEAYFKQGATAISAVGQFTRVTSSTSYTWTANQLTSLTGGENEELVTIEIDGAELDVAGGFDHISVTVADPGTAGKLICLLAILTEPRYAKADTVSAIT